MKPAHLNYIRARTLGEVLDALANDESAPKIYAGGQSIGPMLNLRLARPGTLVDIRHVAALRSVALDARTMSIGAACTHADIEDGVIEDVSNGLFPFVARGIAYRAVRNRGTVGGSLAHADPAADWVSTMVAIGARIVVRGRDGATRRLDADSFMVGSFATRLAAHEVLCAIEVPRCSSEMRWGYHKVCRKTGEFAQAIGVAVQDRPNGFYRVVAGSVDGRPLVLARTTACLQNDGPEPAIAEVEAEIETHLAHLKAAHRQQLAAAVRRSLRQLVMPPGIS